MTKSTHPNIISNGNNLLSFPGFELRLASSSVCDACCLEDQAVQRARCEGQELIKKRGYYQDTGPDKGQHSPLPLPDL